MLQANVFEEAGESVNVDEPAATSREPTSTGWMVAFPLIELDRQALYDIGTFEVGTFRAVLTSLHLHR